MERGAPFSHYQLPKSDPELNLDQHINPNPTVTNDADNKNMSVVVPPQTCMVREQDQFMPVANVIRIMRKVLPAHAKISDDAKETIQECVSEYISFVTGEANERCQREQRKTITAEDILWAMGKLGFEEYVGPLNVFINRYREFETDRGCSLRGESFKPAYGGNGIGFHGPTHAPPPPGPYGYGMLDPSMVMGGGGGRYYTNGSGQDGGSGSGGRYYPNGSGQDGAAGNGGSSSSLSGMSVFDPYAPGMTPKMFPAIKIAARRLWPLNYFGLISALAAVLVLFVVNLYFNYY